VLLAAVAFDVYNKSQGKRSITGLLLKNFQRNNNELKPDETTSTKEVISKEA
jgi:putative multiple sugar transport system permease protein